MRIKEVLRTSNLTWSPRSVHPMYIAAGTSAKQLDASFSTSSTLELMEVDTSTKGWEMPVRGTLNVSSRFNILRWGSADREMGLIAGGGDNGVISLWDPVKILSAEEPAVQCELPTHCGPVRSMDFNPSKRCLLASGASSSEIHIVDINHPEVLMTPGPKAMPEDDIVDLAWNKQVEHILASAHPNSARTIVWDLRKNEPIIQVSDASNRLRCSCIAWHPDVPTQLLTCSDEDRQAVVQIWDLRFATVPTMVLEGHHRGIQTISWCERDNGLLLTCSRDDHMICWNPNATSIPGGEKVVEFASPSQWTFDMAWCPRNPYLIGSSSFSGKLSVFSLFGGREEPQEVARQRVRTSSSSDPFAAPAPAPSQPMNIPPLLRAPSWLMKPCGANFGFGGKLIQFDGTAATVTISQVKTEPELLERSEKLEVALQENTLHQFCAEKAEVAEKSEDKQIWNFIKSTFDGKPRQKYLELLGYKAEELAELVSNLSEVTLDSDTAIINKSDADSTSSEKDSDKETCEKEEDHAQVPSKKPLVINTDDGVDGLISRAMLLGQFEIVVDLCLKAGRMADALAVAMAGGRELFQKTQQEYFRQTTSPSAALLSCIISQKWGELVETVHLDNWKEALAIILSYAKPTEFNSLCDTLAGRLTSTHQLEASLCYICSGNVSQLLQCWHDANVGHNTTPLQLQELIEKVMCLQNTSNKPLQGEQVVGSLLKYSKLLAEQGKLSNALTYMNSTPSDTATEFKYQLHMAINDPSLPRPPLPFSRTRITSSGSSIPPNSPVHSTYSTYTGYTQSTYNPPVAPSVVSGMSAYTTPTQVSYQAPTYKVPETKAPEVTSYTAPNYTPAGPPSNTPTYTSGAPSYNSPPSNVGSTYSAPPGSDYSSVSQYNPYTPQEPAPKPVERRPVGAWNDPPMLKKKTVTTPTITPQKITQPVVGPVQHVDLNPNSPANSPYGQQYNSTQYAPAQYNSAQYAPAPPEPQQQPAPVDKPPLPEHCIPMIHVLETSVADCKNYTQNPTHRRKLDEVTMKVEALKDKLRYNSISDPVVEDLNLIAGALNIKDYHNALNTHSRIAQTANFSEVGAFLPGIKVLLQIGAQLHAVHHY